MQPPPVPEEMSLADISKAQSEFAQSAAMALNIAGFDGVELHGANGYLIDQFLNTATNLREDAYGGDTEGRLTFLFETIDKVAEAIGPGRSALRISPFGLFNGLEVSVSIADEFVQIARRMEAVGLAYLHVVEDLREFGGHTVPGEFISALRAEFTGSPILNGGYDASRAARRIENGSADLVSFGRPFIANPDLIHLLRTGAPEMGPDPSFFYTPGRKGYI